MQSRDACNSENRVRRKEHAVDATRRTHGMRLRWYWNRLRCMSPMEVAYRARQFAVARAQAAGWGTAVPVPTPNFSTRSQPFVAVLNGVPVEPYVAAAERVLSGRLPVFALEYVFQDLPAWNRDPKTGRDAPLVFGKFLDYRNPALVGDIKYLWEPNRHLHLATLAQAYALTGDRRYLDGLRTHLESWLDQCPYPCGPNWCSSLELAVRLINWSVAWQLVGGLDCPMFAGRSGQLLRGRWLEAAYRHMHFIRGHLSRYSSANNHLIGELAGLYIGAHTWPYWPQAQKWRQYAKRHLLRECELQNAADGVNREQAIAYQAFVLDFLLLAGLAGRANGDDFPVAYWKRTERMLEFIGAVMDAGGNVPMIGDADDGCVVRLSQEERFCSYRSLLASGAILFNRPDFKFKAGALDHKSRWLFGTAGAAKYAEINADRPRWPRQFPEGGYYVLGADFDTENEVRIVVDAGPLGYQRIAAHGHADALAFTLSIGGHEFLVDPGTYAYHTEREWRAYFRGTRAHNTVCVDGADQSVQGGAFLWLQHARAKCTRWEAGEDFDRFAGEHDGYRRLADPVAHRRELVFDKKRRRLEVVDWLDCGGPHVAERCWHFAEDVEVRVEPDGTIHAAKAGCTLRLRPGEAVSTRLHYGETPPRGGWISRRFDVKVPTHTVVWRSEVAESTRLRAVLECVPAQRTTGDPRLAAADSTEVTGGRM